jgi:serine/threonine protein kinase
MKFIDGGNLREYLTANGPITPRDRAVRIIKGIMNGLSHLHKHTIVHRDLKSPNVMLRRTDLTPVLIDLGFGRELGDNTILNTMNCVDTFQWTSPEMFENNEWSVKTDIYALGIIIWEIFSGHIPFEGLTMGQLALKVSQGVRPDMKLLGSCKTREDERIMERCWQKDPTLRPTIDELIAQY